MGPVFQNPPSGKKKKRKKKESFKFLAALLWTLWSLFLLIALQTEIPSAGPLGTSVSRCFSEEIKMDPLYILLHNGEFQCVLVCVICNIIKRTYVSRQGVEHK